MELTTPSPEIKSCIHHSNACMVASNHGTNSSSAVDKARIDCSAHFQDIAPSNNRKT